MPVDFKKDAHILAVHGVQVGTDKKITSDDKIRTLVTKSLAASHLDKKFAVSGFFYEDINDDAQKFYQLIGSAITNGKPLVGKLLKTVIDLAGDVVTAAKNTSTAKKIRNKLRKQILESFKTGNQLVVVSHSLGTVYALDVVNELIRTDGFFNGDDRNTWPVQGLVTMGSPLGLDLDLGGIKIFEKRKIETIQNADFRVMRWHNFFNRLDPVVSGNVFGKPIELKGAKGPVEKRYGADVMASHWSLQGHVVVSKNQWLLSHTAYWKNPRIGDRLVDILW